MPEAEDSMEVDKPVSEESTMARHTAEAAQEPGLFRLTPAPQAPTVPLDMIPTLLPSQIAHIVTTLSFTARLSMRAAAFLIECILESSRYGTQASLGITRRMLVAAVSSARRVYLLSNAATNGGAAGLTGQASGHGFEDKNGSFLQVLDKYTNLGIYVIHHSFTLAELFTMSGFYLTSTTLKSARTAAEESVNLFDGLFGSNETSRALSSIITLVRRELVTDERFEAANKSKVSSLTALTKALTAFACLQNATRRRMASSHKLRVLYDCTVFSEKGEGFKSNETAEALSKTKRAAGDSSSAPEEAIAAGPGPTTQASRDKQLAERKSSLIADTANDSNWEQELEDLIGGSGDELLDAPDAGSRRPRRIKRVKDAVYEIYEEIEETTTVTEIMNQLGSKLSKTVPRAGHDVEVMEEPEVTVDVLNGRPLEEGEVRRDGLVEEEDDWMEVNDLLDGESTDSVAPSSQGYTIHEDRKLQLVLRTITKRLRERKQMIRRMPADETSTPDSSERDSSRLDVGRIEWSQAPDSSRLSISRSPPAGFLSVARDKSSAGPKLSMVSAVSHASTAGDMSSSLPITNDIPKTTKHRLYSSRDSSPSQASASPPVSLPPAQSMLNHAIGKAKQVLKPSVKHPKPHSRNSTGASSPKRFKRSSSDSSPSDSIALDRPTTPDRSVNHNLPSAPPPSPQSPTVPLSSATAPSDHQRYNVASETVENPALIAKPSRDSSSHCVRTITNHVQSASQEAGPTANDSQPEDLYPHDHLIRNIHRFMRYSSAAYGQNFLRILGLGNSDFNFPSTGKHHANSWAFAQHTNLPIEALLLSSYTEPNQSFSYKKAPPLVHYIAVDHASKAIVLTCRGTLGLQDVLVDLTCDYLHITVDGGDAEERYFVHSGMYHSAVQLTERQSTVHQTLIDALDRYPEYGLVLCGHSLGGGVAAILAILCATPVEVFKRQAANNGSVAHPAFSTPFVTSFGSGLPPGRPIHCYSYGPPAVASSDLARYARGLITSVVQGSDIVPCLSLGVLRDLRNVSVTLFEEGRVAEEIVGRIIGVYQRKFKFQSQSVMRSGVEPITKQPITATAHELKKGHTHNQATDPGYLDPSLAIATAAEPDDEQALSDWMLSLIKTMRADMDNDKLYPPGKVYIMEYFAVYITGEAEESLKSRPGGTRSREAHRVILRQCDSVEERFGEPMFSKSMLNDHLPSHYERSSQLLFEGLGQNKL